MDRIALVRRNVGVPAPMLWAMIRDFGNPQLFVPSIVHCQVEGEGPGAIRVVQSSRGRTIHERLLRRDDEALCLQYEATGDGAMPLDALRSYRSTVTLTAIKNDCTSIEWLAEGDVDGSVAPVTSWCEALYNNAIATLAAQVGGSGSRASKLFEPVTLGALKLRNRTVMAPMTRSKSPGGVPGPDVGAYYKRRASGGIGAVITEGLAIDHPASIHRSKVPHIFGAAALAAWQQIAIEVQAEGAAFIPQLWHVGGARTKFDDVPNPGARSISASGTYYPGQPYGDPATEADVEAIIASFGRAARAAMEIGCDGINIHGAHGYMIDSFFWSKTNTRSDRYGGDLAGRGRFACEIVAECRRQTGPDFPIMLRFSQWKEHDYAARLCEVPYELAQFLEPLVLAGVDIFDCSTRRFWVPEFEGSDLNLAGWTKKLSGKPSMTVGSVGLSNDLVATMREGQTVAQAAGLEPLMAMLERGDFDLVAIGRALISEPAWAAKVKAGRIAELKGFDTADLQSLN